MIDRWRRRFGARLFVMIRNETGSTRKSMRCREPNWPAPFSRSGYGAIHGNEEPRVIPAYRIRLSFWLSAIFLAFIPLLVSAATTSVSVGEGGARFNPESVTIPLGDTIEWVWLGNNHSVTTGTQFNPDGIFDSEIQNTGFRISFTFPEPGTYPYYCHVHGAMMTGTITVTAAPSSPTPTATPTPTAAPATPTPSSSPFSSHPLVFPPVTTAADIPISISEACLSILDGPCTNMWTYGGTYPGLTIRRPTGQTTRVTFTNNLPLLAGGKTVHHHGNHS